MAGRLWLICITCLFIAAPSAVAAVPGSAEPSRVPERFKPQPTPQATPDINVPNDERGAVPPDADKIHFQLTAIAIDGNTVFSASDLSPLYQGLLGRDVTLAQIYRLRDAITEKYRSAGYILSRAIVPPQKIVGGVVRIQVIEGYVDHIAIQGDGDDVRGLVKATSDNITQSRPLRASTLERYVLLVSDLPGVTVRTLIKPSKDSPAAAELVLMIERKRFSGTAAADNRGSRAIGPEEGQLDLDLNSVFGFDEQTSIFLATTAQPKELEFGRLSSTWTLNDEGLRLALSADYSRSEPGESIAILNGLGRTLNAHALVDYPVIRSRSENLRLGVGFTYTNSTLDLLGIRFNDDRLRYLVANLSYDVADVRLGDARPASTVVSAEISQGLNILDESETGSALLSRANGHSDFTKIYVEATRVQSLGGAISVAISAAGQASATPLLSSVQFGLGGSQFGRGYEPSELTGDEGLAGTIEGRYDLSNFPDPMTHPQLYAFYDTGVVWNVDSPPGAPSQQSLASAGIGFRFDFLGFLSADIELAKPLTRDVASQGDKNVRPLFNISAKY